MDGTEAINRQRIGPILWRERYLIAASIVVMLVLAFVYTASAAKVYQATAILQVNLSTTNPGSSDVTSANQGLAQNYATLLTSNGFLQGVRRSVDGGALSVDDLQSRLSATALQNSALVELHATGASPAEAQTVAQQVVMGFLNNLQHSASSRTQQLQSQLQQQIGRLTTQIATITSSGRPAPEQISALTATRQALINQMGTLVAGGLAQGTSASLSSAPAASSTPISPKRSLNLLAGLLLGVLLGVGVAWLRQAIRPAVRTSEEVGELVDFPLLASIPLKSPFDPGDVAVREAYEVLHANLMIAMRDRDVRVVAFVGYNPQVGKSSVVQGLGQVAALGDRKVLIVDGDMRAGTLSARVWQRNRPGLSDVLKGNNSLDEALVEIRRGLYMLPTRAGSVNAASLLSGGGIVSVLDELRRRFDLVLIDSPPLSGLADGLLLSANADLAVLVVRAGITKPADLRAASNSLVQSMTPVAGTVVFERMPDEPYYGDREPDEESPRPVLAR